MSVNTIAAAAMAVLAAIAHTAVFAQANWPAKPVRLIAAVAPGGGTDVVGRLLAQRMGERLGQPFVVENRGGGGGSIEADAVAMSFDPITATPEAFAEILRGDLARWGRVVREAKVKAG